ncbi:hypothetical protein Mag101_07405 [Microbulbifer agarilyticus]|uniref:Phage gp6-like head-tail connector protein n=1 Tax=Microbulbifer agarilyticus TaxID=260552 RepID=A0A1Q2M427_9GAMM|nr:head-tail connector protein [Microbulbifer agarilyticus]AQQ67484.1 hypothetical protein Mag101_07405 [Microbulbifer agarilyticus]
MSTVALGDAKAHLNVEHSDDDTYIQGLIDAAEDHVAQYLNRDLPWKDDLGQEVSVPASVIAAIKLLIGTLYEVRETTVVGTIVSEVPAFTHLLAPYRVDWGI